MTGVRPVVLAAVFLVALTGCMAQATRDLSLTVPWEPYERVVIRTSNGPVTLATGDVGQVRVDARTRIRARNHEKAQGYLNQVELLARRDDKAPDTLRIELRVPASLATFSPGAALTVTVPAPAAADIATSNGSVTVTDMQGEVVAQTSNGALEIRNISGNVRATTSNGRVELYQVRGQVEARTSNGSVVVRDLVGPCRVETSNGTVEILSTDGDVHATSSNGWMRIVAEPSDEGAVVARTSNGQIRLTLPRTMKGRLILRASNSHVNLDTVDVQADFRWRDREYVRGTLNGGGNGEILADTSNGSITVDFR